MTSRLKRKLNDLGIDPSSSKATENFCLIGTPLPPLEKSKDTGEFVPLWKQEVRDEKGRRRLHGAFTGGFSAGYFNTVGSKEGWTPSEFRSSRTDRAKKQAARPEDFMDEEDLAELRDSQKLVDTTEEMDLDFWKRRKTSGGTEDKNGNSVASALEEALLPAPRDSVGAQILKKMGWRIGNGIGPKVSYEQRKRQDAQFHAVGSDGSLQDFEDHEEASKHMYPPRDTKVQIFKRKDDKHGLGYESGLGLSDLVSREASINDKRAAADLGPKISAGFGLGALNDADEDDFDVYESGTARRRRLAYDIEEDNEQAVMGDRYKSLRPSSQTPREPLGNVTRNIFNNGLPCVPGFVIAENPVVEENLFPPPVVPDGWMPDPRRVWEQDKENFKAEADSQGDAPQVQAGVVQPSRKIGLSAAERGKLLGETPLPAASRSVFDYLKPEDRERLKLLTEGRIQSDTGTPKATQRDPGPLIPEQAPTIPRLDPQVAKMALHGFQPFTNDPVKQTRYTAYLKAQADGEDSVPFSRLPGQAADAFARELEDYARSAQVFKPMSGAMAGRFTRAAVIETGLQAAEGLHRPAEEGTCFTTPGGEGKEEEKKEESPKENAARLGMFGLMTREVKPWIPARLLCKRFGVKEPEVGLPSEPTDKTDGQSWQTGGVLAITDGTEAGLNGSTRIGENTSATDVSPSKDSTTARRRDIANVGLGDEDETQARDVLTYERPGMDIFKAIFASDEEDEGDGEEQGNNANDADLDEGVIQANGDSRNVPSATTSTASRPEPLDYNNMAGKMDINDFKPTFISRSGRAKDKDKGDSDKDRHKDRGKKKKKKKTTLVSFEVGEDDAEEGQNSEREYETSRKKKKRSETKVTDTLPMEEDEGIWVEKAPPETVHHILHFIEVSSSATMDDRVEESPARGRKRAIDFM